MDINYTNGLFDDYELTVIRIKSRNLIGKAGFLPDDLEDIRQEIILDLLQRLPKYDPSKSSRHTFINDLVDNKIANLIEEKNAALRDYHNSPARLDEPANTNPIPTLDYESATENVSLRDGVMSDFELFELREDIIRMLEKLPPHLRDVCIRLLQDNICTVAKEAPEPRTARAAPARRN